MFRKRKKKTAKEQVRTETTKQTQPPTRETRELEVTQEERQKVAEEMRKMRQGKRPPPSQKGSAANDGERKQYSSVFDRHSLTEQEEPSDPRQYKAYDTEKAARKFDIQFANGRQVVTSHMDIRRVDCMTPDRLSIFCSDYVISLQGKNLDQLIRLFRDEKITALRAFNEKLFDAPEDGDTVIELVELKEI